MTWLSPLLPVPWSQAPPILQGPSAYARQKQANKLSIALVLCMVWYSHGVRPWYIHAMPWYVCVCVSRDPSACARP